MLERKRCRKDSLPSAFPDHVPSSKTGKAGARSLPASARHRYNKTSNLFWKYTFLQRGSYLLQNTSNIAVACLALGNHSKNLCSKVLLTYHETDASNPASADKHHVQGHRCSGPDTCFSLWSWIPAAQVYREPLNTTHPRAKATRIWKQQLLLASSQPRLLWGSGAGSGNLKLFLY